MRYGDNAMKDRFVRLTGSKVVLSDSARVMQLILPLGVSGTLHVPRETAHGVCRILWLAVIPLLSVARGRNRYFLGTAHYHRGDDTEHKLRNDEPRPVHSFLQDRVDNSHEAVADA
jgi:hypothetical protein